MRVQGKDLASQPGVETQFVREFKIELTGADLSPIVPEETALAIAPGPDFQPAIAFDGSRTGFVFKQGDSGLGYYKDLEYTPPRVQDRTRPAHSIPFAVDGEPMDARPAVHIKLLPRALTVYAQPARSAAASSAPNWASGSGDAPAELAPELARELVQASVPPSQRPSVAPVAQNGSWGWW